MIEITCIGNITHNELVYCWGKLLSLDMMYPCAIGTLNNIEICVPLN
jgi:hypothetical protein